MHAFVRMTLLAATVAVAACDQPVVAWHDPESIEQAPGATTLMVDSGGHAWFTAPAHLLGAPAEAGLCPASVATALGTHVGLAAWWAVRPDSSAILRVASSPDSGRTWVNARSADTTDVSSSGCSRPPPAVTAVGDDVYVAYSMIAPEGKGVFFVHSMGQMLHSPVAVIYGDHLVATALAADEWHVALAYEEPNGRQPQVGVALSSTQGHIFEQHLIASRPVDDAVAPAVAFSGKTLAVSWTDRADIGHPSGRVVRIGRMQ